MTYLDTAYVKYIAPSNGGTDGAQIDFLDANGDSWVPTEVNEAVDYEVNYQLFSAYDQFTGSNQGDKFSFQGVVFWAKANTDPHDPDKWEKVSNVVRTFENSSGGSVEFNPSNRGLGGPQGSMTFITNVDVVVGQGGDSGSVSFTVQNENSSDCDGRIIMQVTIKDKAKTGVTDDFLFTSDDPTIPLPKK